MKGEGIKRYKKGYTGVEGGIAFFFAVAINIFMSVVAVGVTDGMVDGSAAQQAISILFRIITQSGFLFCALFTTKKLGSNMTYKMQRVRLSAYPLALLFAVICIVGFYGIALLVSALLIRAGFPLSEISGANSWIWVLIVFQTIIFAPICEEILFRGSILSSAAAMTEKLGSRRRTLITVFICGVLFMLMHINPNQTVYQLCFGCVLAYVTIKFRSVIPAIIMHIFNNLIGVILLAPDIDSALSSWMNGVIDSGWGLGVYILVSVILGIAAIFALIRLCRRFGGYSLPYQCQPRPGIDFRNYADDNGTMMGAMFMILGALLCLVLWLAVLVSGLAN